MGDPNENFYEALRQLSGLLPPGDTQAMRRRSYYIGIAALKKWAKGKWTDQGLPIKRFSNDDSRIIEKSSAKGGAKGVGKKISQKIRDWNKSFNEETGLGEIGQLKKFQEADDIEQVWKSYGLETMTPEENLEYELTAIRGVGMKIAKKIRETLNEDPDAPLIRLGTAIKDLKQIVEEVGADGLLDRQQELSLKYHEQISKEYQEKLSAY